MGGLVIVLAAATMGGAVAVQPPAQPAAVAPAVAEKADRSFANADELLVGLETADKDVKTLEADVKYMRGFGSIEGNSREDRHGKVYFRADYAPKVSGPSGEKEAKPRRVFTVDFTELYVNEQKRDEPRVYVFDGEWLLEKDVKAKQVTRRRVVPPGETADPLKIGSGPFPIPIGQKKDDILNRFTATLLPPTDGFDPKEMPDGVNDWVQLKLVPKKGTDEARDFQEVRLWYQKKDLLPRLARTTNVDGGTTEVFLVSPRTNVPIPDATFDTSPPPAGSGWNVDTTEYRRPVDRNP